jgi:hypothetical protein
MANTTDVDIDLPADLATTTELPQDASIRLGIERIVIVVEAHVEATFFVTAKAFVTTPEHNADTTLLAFLANDDVVALATRATFPVDLTTLTALAHPTLTALMNALDATTATAAALLMGRDLLTLLANDDVVALLGDIVFPALLANKVDDALLGDIVFPALLANKVDDALLGDIVWLKVVPPTV